MKVKEIMSKDPQVCSPETNLATAAAMMLEAGCGILPVVAGGTLVGTVTDRDMFIALATRDRCASQLTVGEVAQSPVHTCSPDDDVQAALATMKAHAVRRLPVEGFGHTVLGVVSLNDIVMASGSRKSIRPPEIVDALRAICGRHHPAPHVTPG
jgi:CBS domain-containing protein